MANDFPSGTLTLDKPKVFPYHSQLSSMRRVVVMTIGGTIVAVCFLERDLPCSSAGSEGEMGDAADGDFVAWSDDLGIQRYAHCDEICSGTF